MPQQVEQTPAGEGSVEFSSVDGLGVIRLNRSFWTACPCRW